MNQEMEFIRRTLKEQKKLFKKLKKLKKKYSIDEDAIFEIAIQACSLAGINTTINNGGYNGGNEF